MDLIIRPYIGIGNITFGMTVEEVRHCIAAPVKSFLKHPTDAIPTDTFEGLGIYVEYKNPGICQVVELAKPANPIWRGQSFLNLSFAAARHWFEQIDPELEVDDTGLTSYQFGIGLYAPNHRESPEENVEGVIVFEKGYYEIIY
jgi:hypothetical protein